MKSTDNLTWNDINETCFVTVNGKNAGCPSTGYNFSGLCIVTSSTGLQIAIPVENDTYIYYRFRWGSTWQSWRKISFTTA